jgi:TonB-dependent starch-binding outer membrane protein SusC
VRHLTAILIVPLICVIWSAQAHAQLVVEGQVSDQAGGPLAGANVTVEGTSLGAITDARGAYRLVVRTPGPQTVVVVQYVGYRTARRVIEEQTGTFTANFLLPVDPLRLDEIVVTGTGGAVERGRLGAAIATVSASDIENASAIQLDAALAGKVPGALVQQASGAPGGGTSVRIRGTSTISRSAEPLYIIDGVIIDNSSSQLINLGGYSSNRLADLDPNDIERIEIVKGAAAAALYGSRANDGVVQIFTKRGRAGQSRITYRTVIGVDQAENRIEVNRSPVNAAGEPVTRVDYQDDIFRTGLTHTNSLSIAGGDERLQYYVAASLQGQEGIVRGTDYRRTSARVNLDRSITDWLRLSTSLNYIHSNAHIVPNGGLTSNYGVLSDFLFTPNDYVLYPDPVTGDYPQGFLFANPLEIIARWKAPQEVDRIVGGVGLNASLLPGLTAEYRFGWDSYTQAATQTIPRRASAREYIEGRAISSTQRARLLNSDLGITHRLEVTPIIQLSTGVGMNYQEQRFNIVTSRAEDLPLLTETVLGSRQFTQQSIDTRRSIGFFAQETVAIGEALSLTAGIRSDASSAFGRDQRQQYFPKASGSLDLSRLDLWENRFGEVLNGVRLRAALGYSGGQPAGSYDRFSNYVFAPNSGRSGIVNSQLQGNEDLRPERMREVEVGLDLELLRGRLGVEMTYYDQVTDDLILPRTVTPSTGFTTQIANVGELENKGFELMLRSTTVQRSNFTWSTSATLSSNRPLIRRLSDAGAFFIPESFNIIRVEEGEAPGHFYGTSYVRDSDGRILDLAGNPIHDANGNVIGIPAIGPRKIIGDPNPTANWAITNTFSIGQSLGFGFQFDGVTGHDVFNFDRRLLETPFFGVGREYERELAGEVPSGYFQARRSIFEEYIEDGSFIKLREAHIRYSLRPTMLDRVGVTQMELMLSGRNLFTLSSFEGWDPETNVGAQRTLVRGFTFATIPIPRSMNFGITLVF